MSIWSRILRSTKINEFLLRNKINILLFVEKTKKTIFDHIKQRHQVVGVKKNFYQNFKRQKQPQIRNFQIHRTFLPGTHFLTNNNIVKISPAQPRKIKITLFSLATGTQFFSTSYFSVRAKTPLNARVYVVSNFRNNF